MVYDMVYDMVHDLRKNTVEGQDFFVVHACTKSLHKAHEISCTKTSNSSSRVFAGFYWKNWNKEKH